MGAFARKGGEEVHRDIEWVYQLFPRLKERAKQKGGTLSGGEQQMLALGRGLMSHPDLLMPRRTFPWTGSQAGQRSLSDHPKYPFRGDDHSPHRTKRPGSPRRGSLRLRLAKRTNLKEGKGREPFERPCSERSLPRRSLEVDQKA